MPFVATFLFGMGIAALFTFLAPYALATGRAARSGGFFFAYAIAAIFRIVGARLPGSSGPRNVLVPALLAFAAGLATTPFTNAAEPDRDRRALCGVGHGFAFPILNVLVVARTPARVRGGAVVKPLHRDDRPRTDGRRAALRRDRDRQLPGDVHDRRPWPGRGGAGRSCSTAHGARRSRRVVSAAAASPRVTEGSARGGVNLHAPSRSSPDQHAAH